MVSNGLQPKESQDSDISNAAAGRISTDLRAGRRKV